MVRSAMYMHTFYTVGVHVGARAARAARADEDEAGRGRGLTAFTPSRPARREERRARAAAEVTMFFLTISREERELECVI